MAETGETDYLEGIGPDADGPFGRAVREAFERVHGLRTLQEIGGRIGESGPGVHKALRGAAAMNAKTLRKILSHFPSFETRRRIVAAWELEALGEGLAEGDGGRWEGDAAEVVEELTAARYLERALRVASRSLGEETDPKRKARLLEQAAYLAFRLDDPLAAMEAASAMVAFGGETGDVGWTAKGYALSARALRRAGAPPKEYRRLWRRALALAEGADGTASPERDERVYARDIVESETAIEAAELHRASGELEEKLGEVLLVAKARAAKAETPAGRARARFLEAIVENALGRHFRAEELLDEAFGAGEGWRGTGIRAGILRGRILTARGEKEEATAYYRRLVEACELDRDEYMARLARQELACLLAPE